MGWRGILRSVAAAQRAAERQRSKRLNAVNRFHGQIDRVVDRLDEEMIRDLDKVAEIERKICSKPITASGVNYDIQSDTWSLKPLEDHTGQIRWSLHFKFGSDGVVSSRRIVDGPRQYTLLAFAVTRCAVFAAFKVSHSGKSGKKTKLFYKSDPSKNRLCLILNGKRYIALEGTLDVELFGPDPEIAFVAFPRPNDSAKTATIGFLLTSGNQSVDVTLDDAAIFKNVGGSLVDLAREQMDQEVQKIRHQALATKNRMSSNLAENSGCALVLAAAFLLYWFVQLVMQVVC